NGDMKKKWVIREGARCLLKVTSEYYGQQSVNELIAVRLHERLSWDHNVPYRIEYRKIRGTEYPCSLARCLHQKRGNSFQLTSSCWIIKYRMRVPCMRH